MFGLPASTIGRVPDGGGWRLRSRVKAVRGRGDGHDYPHVAGCRRTNGKAERGTRTLQHEYAHNQAWTGNNDRLDALADWVQDHNTRRAHSALGGHPPITRLTDNNVTNQYT